MTVRELLSLDGFKALNVSEPEREINGAYIGDLLSWVMGRASCDNAWITIMTNVNILAVASLTDVACIILAEGTELDSELIATAKEKGINVISSALSSYGVAKVLAALGV